MTTYEIVTTWSRDGYRCYGHKFLETFLRHSQGIQVTVYHESQPKVDEFHELLTWRNLDHDPDRIRFLQDHGSDPQKIGTPSDPNSQAIRFCHKVFAITDKIRHHAADWVIWVDADVLFTSPITPERLAQVCPDGNDLAFLGRKDAPYTECGFVGYRAAANPVQRMAEDMRAYYTTGEMFTRPRSDWHDSRCFDICRLRSTIPHHRQHNISHRMRGLHVWPMTPLRLWSVHAKGPRRKLEHFGSICD